MIYFLRHGESIANVNKVFAGQEDDTPLSELGKLQAKTAAQEIEQTTKINKIIASPLVRARETAEIVASEIHYPIEDIEIDKRIAEYDMGEITGSPIRKVTSQELVSAKGAENTVDFQNRVIELLKQLKSYKGNVLVVSHAGVGRIIQAYQRNMNTDDFYDLPAYPNAHMVEIDIE